MSKIDVRVRLNGVIVPELKVRKANDGGLEIAVRDETIGWFGVTEDFITEHRDETSWALLPQEMKAESKDKGWCRTSPVELIEIFQATGIIQ